MKIILINNKHDSARAITLGRWSRALLSLCCLGLPLGMIELGYHMGQSSQKSGADLSLGTMQDEVEAQAEQVALMRTEAARKMQALTVNAAEIEARMLRLDAMGERLTTLAGLESGEFDFSQPPAVGGPLSQLEGDGGQVPDLVQEMDNLAARLADREQQLDVLQSLMANRQWAQDVYLAGRPIRKGWMSSAFGRRTDPFTGKHAWHEGVDFAGKEGSDIVTVAAGVVTWSGDRYGYGEMVEISHGGGYSTRYAHNKENKVKIGDIVKKGQVIALMGSSGRSTGPHVHYEVYKNGRPVDPASYVRRTRR